MAEARVYVNHGRWVVDCPGDGCYWSYLAMSDTGGRLWLPGQHHSPRPLTSRVCTGGKAMGPRLDYATRRTAKGCGIRFNLVWPTLAETLAIEEALARRPPANRNWRHPETIDALLVENDVFLVGKTIADLIE